MVLEQPLAMKVPNNQNNQNLVEGDCCVQNFSKIKQNIQKYEKKS
jgi:hypothetical protein